MIAAGFMLVMLTVGAVVSMLQSMNAGDAATATCAAIAATFFGLGLVLLAVLAAMTAVWG